MIDRIINNPKMLSGKPIVQGMRLSVEFILGLLASDVPEEHLLEDYQNLTKENVHARLKHGYVFVIS